MRARGLAVALVLACGAFAPQAFAASAPRSDATSAVEADVHGLASSIDARIGVAAWRIDGTGPKVLLNADEAFPMASTFKIAVAARVLERVDKGEIKLTDMEAVEHADLSPSEVIADRFIHPGVSLSVYNHLELMLTQSDNTATDVMVRVAGGPAAVTDWVRRQGVQGQRIDSDTRGLFRRYLDIAPDAVIVDALPKVDPAVMARLQAPYQPFDDDPRDTSTPAAMAGLLGRIFSGKALSAESTGVLIAIMERCRTGEDRLKGLMPQNTRVAHKTGTAAGIVDDVGVITLPGDAGQVAVAVFVKRNRGSLAEGERAIAEIARAVRDFYLFGARP